MILLIPENRVKAAFHLLISHMIKRYIDVWYDMHNAIFLPTVPTILPISVIVNIENVDYGIKWYWLGH